MGPAGRLRQLNKELDGGATIDREGDFGFSIKILKKYIYTYFNYLEKLLLLLAAPHTACGILVPRSLVQGSAPPPCIGSAES